MVEEMGQKTDTGKHRKQPYENKIGNINNKLAKKFNTKLGIVTDLDREDWQMPTFLDSQVNRLHITQDI